MNYGYTRAFTYVACGMIASTTIAFAWMVITTLS